MYFPNLFVKVIDENFEDARSYRINSDKAAEDLDFTFEYSIDDGIKEIKESLRK